MFFVFFFIYYPNNSYITLDLPKVPQRMNISSPDKSRFLLFSLCCFRTDTLQPWGARWVILKTQRQQYFSWYRYNDVPSGRVMRFFRSASDNKIKPVRPSWILGNPLFFLSGSGKCSTPQRGSASAEHCSLPRHCAGNCQVNGFIMALCLHPHLPAHISEYISVPRTMWLKTTISLLITLNILYIIGTFIY